MQCSEFLLTLVTPLVVVSFPLEEDPAVSFAAWTTTPWTLPSNLALCVNPEFVYAQVKEAATGAQYILAEALLTQLYKEESQYTVVKKFKGSELVGKKYKPLFNYFVDKFPNAFRVLGDAYVTSDSGTGIVHQAPAFGEDDFRVCVREGVATPSHIPCPVDDSGRFMDPVEPWKGQHVKEADAAIIKALNEMGRLVQRSTLTHQYPFCWRSDTPLIYRAVPSWFVKVTEIRDRLVANNASTYWVPDFVKEKRFHNWLVDARDWAISRNRYWGTPLPIWASEDGEEVVVIGSVEELRTLSGRSDVGSDLHRHYLDDVTIPSKHPGKPALKRVSEVFDCWFESGSMPYAQQHYPFENKKKFESAFPADFIAEGIDQTRGWFYTLMVISTALFDKPPFKNLIVNGLVLAADGKKMSKRLKNYPDPMDVIHKYGADALRLYLINSPVVKAESLRFQEKGVADVLKDVFNRWYNAYRFLVQNAGDKFVYDKNVGKKTTSVMDKWILASTNSLIKFVRQEMEAYRLYTVVPRLVKFIDELANWYVRLNRDRLKGKEGKDAQQESLSTLALVLLTLCRLMGPFTPFFVEFIYQNLKSILPKEEQEDSVHFLPLPTFDDSLIDEAMETAVERMQLVIELGRTARERSKTPLKQPLREMVVFHTSQAYLDSLKQLQSFILSELNIKAVVLRSDMSEGVQIRAVPDWKRLGKTLRGDMKKVADGVAKLTNEQLVAFEKSGSIDVEGYTLTSEDLHVVREYKDSSAPAPAAAPAAEGGKGKKGGAATAATPAAPQFEVAQDPSGVFVVLSLVVDEEMIKEGISREVVNRVNRLRREIKLQVTDQVVAFYEAVGKAAAKGGAPVPGVVDEVIAAKRAVIELGCNTPVLPNSFRHPQLVPLGYVNTEVNEAAFKLWLCRPAVGVDLDTAAALLGGDKTAAVDLRTGLVCLNPDALKQELSKTSKKSLIFNGKKIEVTLGKEIFMSVVDLAKSKNYKN